MDWLLYIAIVVVSSLISIALAPKPPKQKPYALEDFDLPTAERDRALPWVFGTRTITDPNFIWYGDLEVATKTKDKVKTRLYGMGFVLEICIGPVDSVTRILYGDKECWAGNVTASEQIFIDQLGLYGGREKDGGIYGYMDLQFGEPTQAVNDYLLEHLGSPLTAYRDSLTFVGRHMWLAANSPYVKAITPTVKCILAGWPAETPWYPEKAEIGDGTLASYDRYCEGEDGGPTLDYWWKLSGDLSAAPAPNVGAGSPTATLALAGTLTSASYNQAPVTLGTDDEYSLYRSGGYYNYLICSEILINGSTPFSAGLWVNTASGQQILFASNYGGTDGTWRGLYLYVETGTPDYISVILGDGIGGHYRLKSGAGSFSLSTDHFVSVYCEPDSTVAGTVLKLWIDGVVQTLTYYSGSATAVAWPITASTFDGVAGIGFDAKGDTFGLASDGYKDEAFYHPGELSTQRVLEMYQRGAGLIEIGGGDMNPAHIIYKCLVDQHQGQAEPAAVIDDASFRYAADVAYAEGLGFSFYWRNQGSIKEFIAEVCQHAGFVRSIDPSTGKYTLIPLRDDYTPGALDLITESEVLEVLEWSDAADGEATNEVTVIYRDKVTNNDTPATWHNRASVAAQGIASTTRQYPGVSNYETAIRIAKRDVKESSSNLSKGKLRVNRSTWDKLPGAVFRLSHGPEDISEIVVRVTELDAGTLTDSAMTISVMQDVFSLPLTVPGAAEQESAWSPPVTTPAAVTVQEAIELPYYWLRVALGSAETAALPAAAGYGLAIGKKPQALADAYNLHARISPDDYTERAVGADWPYTALLNGAIARSASALVIDASTINPLEVTSPGALVLVGTGATMEWMRLTGGDLETGLTVDRGILDTTPQEHADNSPVWVIEPEFDLLDTTLYSDGDAVDYKLLTRTDAGVLPIASASAVSVTLASRQVRPYPPGDVAINTEAFPILLEGALSVTWAHRDRTEALIVTQGAASSGPEAGTTYNAYAYDDDTETLLDSDTGISGTSWAPTISASYRLRIEIESERDGYACWQRQVRVFEYLDSSALLDTGGDYLLDASGDLIQEA